MNRFPIGFWNYTSIDKHYEKFGGAKCVDDWAEAGMTLAMGPKYGPEPDQIAKMRTILDAAADRDIQVILCDGRCRLPRLIADGEVTCRQNLAQAVKEFGDHPAVFGFHCGDEPHRENFDDVCRLVRICKEAAPHLTPFLNHLPWTYEQYLRIGHIDFGEYLDAYVDKASADLLCYDFYAQMREGTWGRDGYFRNLRLFQEASVRHNVPWWTTLLSVGHWSYRVPNENELRWQINTAAAHGAKGLLWFFFYMREPGDNYRLSPIDEMWKRTPTFDALSRVCNGFLNSVGPVLKDLTLKKVQHAGTAWGGNEMHCPDDRVWRVVSPGWVDLIISQFQDARGRDYVCLVNNDLEKETLAELTVLGRKPKLVRMGWQGVEEHPSARAGVHWRYVEENSEVRIRPWLAPGQLELYRVEEDAH